MNPEFRAGEREARERLECTECGGPAEGNHSWADGSGEICDACVRRDACAHERLRFHGTEETGLRAITCEGCGSRMTRRIVAGAYVYSPSPTNQRRVRCT